MTSFRVGREASSHVVATLVLTALAIVYAWPLLSTLTVSIPATAPFADVSEYVWSTGWVAQALANHKSLFYTDLLFFPFGADLRLNTFGLLQGLIAFPITPVLGIVGAYNLVLVLTLVLNGVTGYLLTFDVTRNVQAALISSSLFMLSSPILQHIVLGRSALGAMWIVAGTLYAFRKTLARPRIGTSLLFGGTLAAGLLTDFQIFLFTLLWLVVYGVGLLCTGAVWPLKRSQIAAIGLPVLFAGFLFAVLYAPVFSSAFLNNYPQPGLQDMSVYSLRWWDFLKLESIPYVYAYEFGVLALIAAGTFRWSGEYRLWLLGALFFAVLALGPFLLPTKIPLPFAGFSLFPPLRQFRTPYRLIMPAQIGLMVVAGLALAQWTQRVRSRSLQLAFGCTVLIANMLHASALQPFQTQIYRDYDFYHRLALQPETFTLLEVPFGVRSGLERIGRGGEVVQYYQHVHRKRLLSGSMARVPSRIFQFYREQPSLMFLGGQSPELTSSNAELNRSFADVLRWSDTRYVLLHHNLMSGAEYLRYSSFLDRQAQLKRVGIESDLTIYKVEPAVQ
jgi:hypothetical protein